jgi:hypothetical protein
VTEQEELQELTNAEAEFLKHWDPKVGVKPGRWLEALSATRQTARPLWHWAW